MTSKFKTYTIEYIDDNGQKQKVTLNGTKKQFQNFLHDLLGDVKLKQKGNYFYDEKLEQEKVDKLPFIFEFQQKPLSKTICQTILNLE
jgi:hypothetical protein